MAERKGRPWAGWLMLVAVVVSVAVGGVFMALIGGFRELGNQSPAPGWWFVAAGAGGAVLLALGLGSAWWVGTGRGARLGRPATACLVGLLTMGATFGVAFGARTCRGLAPVAALAFLSGLWLVWRVGAGRWGLRRRTAGQELPQPE